MEPWDEKHGRYIKKQDFVNIGMGFRHLFDAVLNGDSPRDGFNPAGQYPGLTGKRPQAPVADFQSLHR